MPPPVNQEVRSNRLGAPFDDSSKHVGGENMADFLEAERVGTDDTPRAATRVEMRSSDVEAMHASGIEYVVRL